MPTSPHNVDVLVCGAGPAGLGAALAAARNGVRTMLVERESALGGLWTTALVMPVFDAANKGGLCREIHEAMTAGSWAGWWTNPDPGKKGRRDPIYHVGHMAALFDRLVTDAGVALQTHTIVDEAIVDHGRVAGAVLHSKSGPQPIRAAVTIDCTGDGDVAAAAGCEHRIGRDDDGACQPATLYALVGGAPNELVYPPALMAAVRAAGGELSYAQPYLFPQAGAPGVSLLMCTHLYRLDATDAAAVTAAEVEGRRQIVRAIDWLRAGDERFASLHLIHFAGQIGIRESRRILGRHYLTVDEVAAGCKFDDGICTATFNIDIHDQNGNDRGLKLQTVPAYEIPFRCLLPGDRRGLMVAGRCISGDAIAHASYRVTGNAVALGEAAGVAAAMAVRDGKDPADLDGAEVRAAVEAYRAG